MEMKVEWAVWDGIPVYLDNKLALNTLVRDYDEIRVSGATFGQLERNPEMLKCARLAAQKPGVHSIMAMRRVPNHRVGAILRESHTMLNAASSGGYPSTKKMRAEIEELRALLDEAEMTLDTVDLIAPLGKMGKTA